MFNYTGATVMEYPILERYTQHLQSLFKPSTSDIPVLCSVLLIWNVYVRDTSP